ncbi:MAG: glycine--tRNA ligase subunit beta [Candidatus Omnitrophica bacterium]|nr:glycine--tRNA ligase subunit beta [Candidatus Omnitrophota bacterium]
MRKPKHAPGSADLLFEIGTEELPAAYLDGAIAQLGEEAERLLRDSHLTFASVASFGTPRRLTLIVRGLGSLQRNPAEEIRGPSKQAAFNAQGRPTEALKGFLRGRGGTLSQVKTVSTGKGEYVYLVKSERHVPTAQVLPQLLAQLIGRVRCPKMMRWDESGVRFARPIRWLLACYGRTAVRVAAGRLIGGRATRVGGPRQPKPVAVSGVASYLAALKRAGVILDQGRRRARIDQLVKQAAKRQGGVPAPEVVSHGLLDEVTHLVERPVPLVGRFDKKYLVLPRELLLASMAKYQRVFALQTSAGKLLPAFVAILDGTPAKMAQVRRMYEHILNARLADSLLFWEQDHTRLPLAKFGRLRDITFHERLGSMEDKTQRLDKLRRALAEAWQLTDQEQRDLERACLLAKYDLLSSVVREFPTLQGIVGKYYAIASKEPSAVAAAIGEQYLPAGDQLPKTLVGSALALLDKYDTLSSYFAIGIEPTGDQDPFGLRRAAQGVVEVAWAVRKPLPIDRLGGGPRIRAYLAERLYTFAWPAPASAASPERSEGMPPRDLIDAVLSSPWDDLVDAMERIRHLRQLDGNQTLLRAAKVVERTTNILKGASLKQDRVDPSRFQEPLERELWQRYDAQKDRIGELIRGRAYAEATKAYGETFFEPLHEFFERVMVNVQDEALQQNRLALMNAIKVLYTDHVADLSKLAILQSTLPSSRKEP